ncbi:DUF4280 domain-containing protein [Capnocytophaga sp. oral taxon 864]|uniref:DUF4280 domain-containing protein n=1 Tax=Capnocytophaga sp. oral taxon 864 TaxID=1316593 RepID=UPI000D045259|nr:DUF4280 domain-containing protein [Capnocytophaga sp. oral taxon 864]AVM55729.1 DUF4280 domain-containing protein [Capnocytophaga sp. oral taxon 864]
MESITDSARMKCSEGSKESTLIVTSQNHDFINGKLQATEEDKQANINIPPFGQCRLKPTSGGYLPCMPIPTQWENTSFATIDSKKELNKSSCMQCAIGGKITFTNSGENNFVSSEVE